MKTLKENSSCRRGKKIRYSDILNKVKLFSFQSKSVSEYLVKTEGFDVKLSKHNPGKK